jgi:hypothetical protein
MHGAQVADAVVFEAVLTVPDIILHRIPSLSRAPKPVRSQWLPQDCTLYFTPEGGGVTSIPGGRPHAEIYLKCCD